MRTALFTLVGPLAWAMATPAFAAGGGDPAPAAHPAAAQAAGTLYLNRCLGGCTVHLGGINDAKSLTSQLPMSMTGQTDFVVSPYAWGDTEWNAVMQCVREVYSPFAVTVTDVEPAPGVPYNEGIVAGVSSEIGLDVGGIAPITGDCSPYSYVLSFTFANEFGGSQRVFEVCAVAAQETAHAYGLDHAYQESDGSSACIDPMTYRTDCGGEKFFRNDETTCGEYQPRQCRCGGLQNAHLKLLNVLGPGTPITTPPTISLLLPADGATVVDGATVQVTAAAQRGVKTVELWLNNYNWGSVKGAAWGPTGQPESNYTLTFPPDVPDGVIDVVVKAKDDIDATTATTQITVTKGLPCVSAATCADGQQCADGKCFWDAPAGEIGDTCTFPQYCKSGLCDGTATQQICTQQCVLGVADSCPTGLDCVATGANGICFPGGSSSGGGCCSANGDNAAGWLLSAMAVGIVLSRKRRVRPR